MVENTRFLIIETFFNLLYNIDIQILIDFFMRRKRFDYDI